MSPRGRIVLWSGEGRRRKGVAELLGVSLSTADRWKTRNAEQGPGGAGGERTGGARGQVPARYGPRDRADAFESRRHLTHVLRGRPPGPAWTNRPCERSSTTTPAPSAGAG
ncbi:helix-turn-helix domain-containing protein [Streptomyces sp. MNU76]|uniref:helix-turn-helix domain-containing protein n=1 Tax=Streptomyces sp. MNU76 TaxID=2560026 RepID=UPI0035A83CE5